MLRPKLARFVSSAIMFGGLVICFVSLARLQQKEPLQWSFEVGNVLFALLSATSGLIAMAGAWRNYLRALSTHTLSFAQSFHQVAVMLVGKYVPIMIGGVLARVSENSGRVAAAAVVTATVIEQLGAMAAALAIGVLGYAAVVLPWAVPVLIACLLAAVWFAPALLGTVRSLAARVHGRTALRLQQLSLAQSSSDLRGAVLLQLLQWLALSGFVATVATMVMPGLSAEALLIICAAYAIAVVAGIAVVFLPGGLGAREAVFVGLSAVSLDTHEALQLALSLRIAMSAFDVLAFALSPVIRASLASRSGPPAAPD